MPPAMTTAARVQVTIAVFLPPREISCSSLSRNCGAALIAPAAANDEPGRARARIACCSLAQTFTQEEITMPQTGTQSNRKATGQKPAQAPKGMPATSELSTEDQVYGLVSVLYHALQGAETT